MSNRQAISSDPDGIGGMRALSPLTDRTLALSAARRFDEPLVSKFADDLLGTQVLGQRAHELRPFFPESRPTRRLFEQGLDRRQEAQFDLGEVDGSLPSDRAQALAVLRPADLGIDDVVVDDETATGGGRGPRLRLTHRTAGDPMPLDFSASRRGRARGSG